jgi:hypothetical protein
MPDLVQFGITRLANASLSVPRWQVSGQIVDSKTQQTVLADFTGGNAVIFPTILGQLSNARQDELVAGWITGLLHDRFGV